MTLMKKEDVERVAATGRARGDDEGKRVTRSGGNDFV
jgi:hypothetical protein